MIEEKTTYTLYCDGCRVKFEVPQNYLTDEYSDKKDLCLDATNAGWELGDNDYCPKCKTQEDEEDA